MRSIPFLIAFSWILLSSCLPANQINCSANINLFTDLLGTLAYISALDCSNSLNHIYIMIAILLSIVLIFIIISVLLKRKVEKTAKDLLWQKEQLALAIKAGDVKVWGYDVKRNLLYNIEGKCFPETFTKIEDVINCIHPDYLHLWQSRRDSILRGEDPKESTVICYKFTESENWTYIEENLFLVRNSDGEVERIVGTHKNITQKYKEKARKEYMLEQYQKVLDASSVKLEIYDNQGVLLSLSNEDEHKSLIKLAENFKDNDFVNEEVLQNIAQNKSIVLTKKIQNTHNDGVSYDLVFVEIAISPILNASGQLDNIVITLIDVTDNISKTKELISLNEEKEIMLSNMPDGYVMFNNAGEPEYANNSFCKILGIDNFEEFRNSKINIFDSEFFGPDISKCCKENINIQVKISVNFDKIKPLFSTRTEGVRHFLVRCCSILSTQSQVKGYMLIINDETSEVNHSKAIKESHRKTELAVQVSGLIQWDFTCSNEKVSLNKPNGDSYDVDIDYILSKICDEDIDKVLQIIAQLRRGDKSPFKTEVRVHLDDDINKYYSVTGTPLKLDSQDNVMSYTGFIRDNTLSYNLTQELKSQNELNQLVLDNMRSGIVFLDLDGIVLWENVSVKFPLEVTGGKLLFEVGKHCWDSHSEAKIPCEDCLVKAVTSGRCTSMDTKKKLLSGSTIEIVANAAYNDNKELKGVVLRVDDISIRTRLYDEVETARNDAQMALQLLQDIVERIPGLIFIKDANDDFRYILGNKMFEQFCGYDAKYAIGKTDYDLYDKDEADEYVNADKRVIESGGNVVIDSVTNLADGSKVYWQITKSAIHTVDGRTLIVALGADLTKEKEYSNSLKIAKEKAEEADKLKSAFLANMSHEIRTPLNAIVGFSELVINTEDVEDRKAYCKIIATNNELLLRLINDILDLSKLDAGTVELCPIEFDLPSYIKELEAVVRVRMKDSPVKLMIDNPYKDYIVSLDRNKLTQIIMNFVTNSIKYTPSGYIKVGYKEKDGGVLFYVEDSGIGIADNKKDKIFQRFEKLDQFAQGTGLGLSICKSLAELNGGKIGFESEQGKGSYFWFWKKRGI